MKRIKFILGLLTIAILVYACKPTCDMEYPNGKDLDFVDSQNVALKGFDVVSFFSQKESSIGNDTLRSLNNGVIYKFSTPKNKNLFDENPGKYMPQMGGFCTVAASKGKVEEVDLKHFEVYNDKLYFATNEKAFKMWKANPDEISSQAHTMWPCLVDQHGRNL